MSDVEPSQAGLASGDSNAAALNGGYHTAFLVGALFATVAAVVAATLLRSTKPAEAAIAEPA